jgi:hypothetical protein
MRRSAHEEVARLEQLIADLECLITMQQALIDPMIRDGAGVVVATSRLVRLNAEIGRALRRRREVLHLANKRATA